MSSTHLFAENPGVLSLDEADSLLQPYLPMVVKCIETPIREWKALCEREPLFALSLDSRARANVINSHVVKAVEKKFSKVKGVHLTRDHGFLVLIIKDKIVVRFKKLDAKLRSSNIMTNQQQKLYYQRDIPGLPPGATVVIAGYRLDATGMLLSDVHVVCPIGRRNKWAIPVLEGAEQTIRLPAASAPPRRVVVSPRGGARTRKSEAQ